MNIDLTERTAVITGGGSGIGRACAMQLKRAGATVIIADKNSQAASSVSTELACDWVAMDVGDENSVQEALRLVDGRWGKVDVLVNSAGVLQRTLPPDQLSMKEWDLVANIDLRGTYLCCSAFGTAMARAGGGAIINIASIAGMRSGPLHAYAPAKAAVISLTECLAGEWGGRGVRVNAVSPGYTLTPALERGFVTRTLDVATLTSQTALGRLVAANEIANAVLFLASDLASAITGVNLPVDAGHLVATGWTAYGGMRPL